MNHYSIIVGNIGTAARLTNKRAALRAYRDACEDADASHGRASCEAVTLTCNGEPIAERVGGSCDLLTIDAWRCLYDRGWGTWQWNAWHKVARVPLAWCDLDARGLFAKLRAAGYLAPATFQRSSVARTDDGHNVVIEARGTGEPLLALAYGAEDDA